MLWWIHKLHPKNLLSPLFLWRPVSYILCEKRPTNKVFLLYIFWYICPSNPFFLFIGSFLQCFPLFPFLLSSFFQYPFLLDSFRRFSLSYLVYFVHHCCNKWSCTFLIHKRYLRLKRNSNFENTLRNSNLKTNV